MNWSWLRAEIKTILLCSALVGVVAVLAVHWGYAPQRASISGFGPGWDCTATMKGDPICVKRIGGK